MFGKSQKSEKYSRIKTDWTVRLFANIFPNVIKVFLDSILILGHILMASVKAVILAY